MRILVTGASGFIGHSVVRHLVLGNYEILALTRESHPPSGHEMKWWTADLGRPESYRSVVQAFAPHAVIHLAWRDIPDFSLSTSLENLRHSLSFLEFVLQTSSCRKILVAGSCFELDMPNGECSEDGKCSANNHFAWAKIALRHWLEMEARKKQVTFGWMRIFYAYGPGQRRGSLLPTILEKLQCNQLPTIRTPYDATDFVYVDDIADGFIRAIERDIPSGVYHLGSGLSTPAWKLCREAEKVTLGTSTLTEDLLKREVPRQMVNFWAKIERAHELLGWEPKTSLDDGIVKTWKWMQSG